VVRTSVFRLSKEGWLTATQAGRRSWYGPTQSGRRRFEAADRIIYAVGSRPWSENWTIVFTGLIEGEARETVRADLAWQGFGQLLPGVMLHPAPDEASVREVMAEAGLASRAAVMKATGNGWMSAEAVRDTAARAWDLGRLASSYAEFSNNFKPFVQAVASQRPSPLKAFRLRILLIHAWRRAILRDPLLPEELLPAAWPGAEARLLCRDLYCKLHPLAEAYLAEAMESPNGPVVEPSPQYLERFGGLGRETKPPAGHSNAASG
jgi:phenylacetic acid degradation operon negative regulatory protein